jgi:hypothetical protein
MEVILTICLALKQKTLEIEDMVLYIVPDWEDLEQSLVIDEISKFLFNNQSFDFMIVSERHKSSLISSLSFLLSGSSSIKANIKTEKYISSMNLNVTNVFQEFCESLLLLCVVFLSKHQYFSYGENNFHRDLILISDLELIEIFKSEDSIATNSNPILSQHFSKEISALDTKFENKFDKIDNKFDKIEDKFNKMESNFEKMMNLLVSIKEETSNDSKNVSASNPVLIPSVFNAVKTPLVWNHSKSLLLSRLKDSSSSRNCFPSC